MGIDTYFVDLDRVMNGGFVGFALARLFLVSEWGSRGLGNVAVHDQGGVFEEWTCWIEAQLPGGRSDVEAVNDGIWSKRFSHIIEHVAVEQC